jgi:hypothetical protein
MTFALGSMYHIEICHHIGIYDNASSHDKDAMSSHMPQGPFICILLAQLDISLHAHVLFTPFVAHMGVINALERVFTRYEGDYT